MRRLLAILRRDAYRLNAVSQRNMRRYAAAASSGTGNFFEGFL
jgi:hypothetical protein